MKSKVLYILKLTGMALIVLTLLGYAAFAWVMAKRWQKEYVCTEVQIEILDTDKYQFISKDEVMQALGKKNINPVGHKVSSMVADSIEKCIGDVNVVKNVECYALSDTILHIVIEQKEPVFRVITADSSYYIDRERHTLSGNKHFATIMPLVTGHVTPQLAAEEIYDFVLYLSSSDFWRNHIGQIDIKADSTIVLVTKAGVEKIILGDMESYKERLALAKKWYDQYPEQAWSDKYTQIDLRYNNIIYCKKKGDKNE